MGEPLATVCLIEPLTSRSRDERVTAQTIGWFDTPITLENICSQIYRLKMQNILSTLNNQQRNKWKQSIQAFCSQAYFTV